MAMRSEQASVYVWLGGGKDKQRLEQASVYVWPGGGKDKQIRKERMETQEQQKGTTQKCGS